MHSATYQTRNTGMLLQKAEFLSNKEYGFPEEGHQKYSGRFQPPAYLPQRRPSSFSGPAYFSVYQSFTSTPFPAEESGAK